MCCNLLRSDKNDGACLRPVEYVLRLRGSSARLTGVCKQFECIVECLAGAKMTSRRCKDK